MFDFLFRCYHQIKFFYCEIVFKLFVCQSLNIVPTSFTALSENRFTGRGEAGTIYRIVTYIWILFGLAYVALIINYISGVLVKKAEKVQKMSRAKIEVL